MLNIKNMFRNYFTQTAIFAKVRALKLSGSKKTVQPKSETNAIVNQLNSVNNDSVKAKEILLQETLDCKTQLKEIKSKSPDNDNCKIYEQIDKDETKEKEEPELLSKVERNESKSVNKFQIMENLDSFSMFGSKSAENYGIQCIGNNMLNIPSVTYILNDTMSAKAKAALEYWKKNIIEKYGTDYFNILSKALLEDGKLFHSCIQNILTNKDAEIPARVKAAYFSVEPILKEIQTVHILEKFVTHPTLRYRGIVDCIACYRDQLYVIDWKKSGKQKSSLAATYDAPVQLAAYIGAINASDDYPFMIDRGLVVVAYTNGEPATIHELNNDILKTAWSEWLKRLEQFYKSLNARS